MKLSPPTEFLSIDETRETWLELLSKGHQVRMKLDGYSMFPLLLPNDIALVDPFDNDVERGTVLVAALPEKWIAHRLVKTLKDDIGVRYLMRGDCTHRDDPILERSNIVGVVNSVQRKGRTIAINAGWRALVGQLMVGIKPIPQVFAKGMLKFYRLGRKLGKQRFV